MRLTITLSCLLLFFSLQFANAQTEVEVDVEEEVEISYPVIEEEEFVAPDELIDVMDMQSDYELEEAIDAPAEMEIEGLYNPEAEEWRVDTETPLEEEPNDEGENVFPEALKTHPYIRYQSELNDPKVAEAYPWISADGLRLYYVKGNSIYTSSRGSRYEDFGSADELNIENNSGITSCWLTNDELQLFTTTGGIGHYRRENVNDRFEYVTYLDVDDKIQGFTSSISFTPDMKTAVLYNSPSSEEKNLAILDVKPDGSLKLRKRFYLEDGILGVGQLSKDGKSVYFTNEISKLHKDICKASLADIERDAAKIESILELKGVRIGKPSLTYDETYMVFNANANDRWQDNEIMVVDLNNLSFIPKDPKVFLLGGEEEAPTTKTIAVQSSSFDQPKAANDPSARTVRSMGAEDFALKVEKIYPNPTKGKVSVQYQIPVNADIAQLLVNDMTGREIYRKKLDVNSRLFTVDLKELGVVEGTYLFFLHTELGTSASKQIYFQSEN